MTTYFSFVFRTAWGLAKGLGLTFWRMFTPSVTVQYPYEKLVLADRFRGALAFHPDICISCDMCVRACPSRCISLQSSRNEETKRKDLAWYKIDFAKCNFCRLCEEICPTKPKSVHHTLEYELSFTRREDFLVTWRPEVPQPAGSEPGQIWAPFLTQGQVLSSAPPTASSRTPSRPVA